MLSCGILEWTKVTPEALGFQSHFKNLPPDPSFFSCSPHPLAKETQRELHLSCKGGNKYETPIELSTLGAAKSGPTLTLQIKTNSQRPFLFPCGGCFSLLKHRFCCKCRGFRGISQQQRPRNQYSRGISLSQKDENVFFI